MYLVYRWLTGSSLKQIKTTTGHSERFITSILNDCQDLLSLQIQRENIQLGGPNMTVEVDETKFGHRKYHRGRLVKGVWVLGGVERDNPNNLFLEVVLTRNAQV